MQKKEGFKLASGESKRVFKFTLSRMSENAFLECRKKHNVHPISTISYIFYSFMLYKYCIWDYILLSLLENVKAANTSKKKGIMYWGGGKHCSFAATGGRQRNWMGNCPQSIC